MTLWKIEYWKNADSGNSPIEKWLYKLTEEQAKKIFIEISQLSKFGNKLGLPQSRALGKGLFELREMVYGYRIYYGFHGKQIVILLTIGDKTSQEHDIKIARHRLMQVKKG